MRPRKRRIIRDDGLPFGQLPADLEQRLAKITGVRVHKTPRGWILNYQGQQCRWLVEPNRAEIAATLRHMRRHDPRPSFVRPNTLGWRGWDWNEVLGTMVSPSMGTPWTCAELRVENWDDSMALRGAAGIHACRLPRGDWRVCRPPHEMSGNIIGLVERFGKFILGEEGWRAEWVIIKELLCADEALARVVHAALPDVPVSAVSLNHWLRKEKF